MATRTTVPAKIRHPRVAPDAITRPGPSKLLDRVPDHRVTLITAPAGFGKSWLVSDWLEWHSDWHQSWVTVDAHDHDPMRMWSHIIQSIGPSGSAEAAKLLAAGQSGIPLVVDTLAAALARRAEPTVIVLDDIHLLEGDEACASIDQFLTALPDTVNVILAGRHEPKLRLSRWRLAGDLLAIRTHDLRCTLPEATELITDTLGLSLQPEIITDLHTKTMGWIAGIRLSAMAAGRKGQTGGDAGKPERIAPTDHGYEAVGDYLVEEVLRDIADQDRQFLLDTSVLHDLTAPLCDAVSERNDSAVTLERLVQSGMFTTRLAGPDASYRYHDLFRDFLTGVLRRTAPGRHVDLHRRAALWLHDHDDPVGAVEHALRADDPDLAGQWLVESSLEMLKSQQYETMCSLFSRIDEASRVNSPVALYTWCYTLFYGNAPGAMIDDVLTRTLASIEAAIETADVEQLDELAQYPDLIRGTPSELATRVAATVAHRLGDTDSALRLVGELTDPSDGGRVEGVAGEMLIYLGRIREGSDLLKRYSEFAFSTRNPVFASQALALLLQAWAAIGQGRLAEAETLAERGVEIMQSHGLGDGPHAALAKVPLAWVAFERGHLSTAADLLEPVVDLLDRLEEVPAYVLTHTLLARINHNRGDRAAAGASLEKARVLPSKRVVAGHFSDYVTFEQARLALLDGDLTAAEIAIGDWRQRCDRGGSTMAEHLLLARFLIVAGEDPLPILATQPEKVDITNVHRIETHKLRAIVASRDGDDITALDQLTEAMGIAKHTGHRQTFLDEARTLGVLLDNAAAFSGHRLSSGPESALPESHRRSAATLAEPLTQREWDILQLLPSHLTYRGMAETLSVSTNTVKSYLKSIYRKLDADKRSDAVANARTLGFID